MQFLILFFFSTASFANGLWQEDTPIPLDGRANPYQLSDTELKDCRRQGLSYALQYPVDITGVLVPFTVIDQAVNREPKGLLRKFLMQLFGGLIPYKSVDHMNEWLGLHKWPEQEDEDPYWVPLPEDQPRERMGFSFMQRQGAEGMTYSCAACHSANLFGRKVLGMTNRFSRSNSFFKLGKKLMRAAPTTSMRLLVKMTREERKMYSETRKRLVFIGERDPQTVGLDTSLAHVALALSRRAPDEFATLDKKWARRPRHERLKDIPADSKPMVWWTAKYKNRWLSDGSVVSGNPILTNIIWNEVGRGTDLHELENWMDNNQKVIQELTSAVFASTPPPITDFIAPTYFNFARLENGRKIFHQSCARCHGDYIKNWERLDSENMPLAEKLKNWRVEYHEQTPVKNVGTDEFRLQGMSSLMQLNNLALSKNYGIVIKESSGYVPPPLVGIWARWPYLHNNSIPNLCALMTPPKERPIKYWAGPAQSVDSDYDLECSGYPLGDKTPSQWKENVDWLYDTSKQSMSNSGHYENIFQDHEGNEKFTAQQKLNLIHFLQTL